VFRRTGCLLGVVWCVFCVPTFARSMEKAIAPVSVSIYNDAQVPPATLVRAEGIANRILQQAGIEITWFSCGGGSRCETGLDHDHASVQNLSLRVVTCAKTLSNSVFGVSFLGSDSTGKYGDVFYNTARSLSESTHIHLGDMLGHVIAHELGHLLLGSNAHSQLGIMRPHWSSGELRSITMGRLLFTPEQARSMQDQLEDRARLARNSVSEGTPLRP
jgi:hypothetical protein